MSSVRIGDMGVSGNPRKHSSPSPLRRKGPSGKIIAILVIVVLVVSLIVGGFMALKNAPIFTIKNVQVEGTEHLTSSDLTKQAAVPIGSTLLNIDTAAIQSRLLENGWVKTVSVDPQFPDTLKITITERSIAATVVVPTEDAKSSAVWAIDSDGVWLMEIPDKNSDEAEKVSDQVYEDAANVLQITGVPYGVNPKPGQYCTDDNVMNALKIVEGMTTQLADQVVQVRASGTDSTTLILDNGIEIAFGDGENIREKERVCLALMDEHPGKIVYINVSIVDRPTYRSY